MVARAVVEMEAVRAVGVMAVGRVAEETVVAREAVATVGEERVAAREVAEGAETAVATAVGATVGVRVGAG